MGRKKNDPATALRRRIEVDANGCWIWQGAIGRQGYGQIRVDYQLWSTHRLAYLTFTGPIPDGLHLDHLCRVRSCCNPEHLEPVTCRENYHRSPFSNVAKTHCPQGHPYSTENTALDERGSRRCRICRREAAKRCKVRRSFRAAGVEVAA